jgi:hypothetical protein
MAVMTVMPREEDRSVEDLDRLPDDGLRYAAGRRVLLVSPSPRRSVQPDLLVDLLLKRGLYADGGVASYGLVDPDPDRPSITVLELDGAGGYRKTGQAIGDEPLTVERPYPVTVVPAALVDG